MSAALASPSAYQLVDGMPVATRVCPACRRVLTEFDFYPNRARSDGLSWACRPCTRARNARKAAVRRAARDQAGLCLKCGRSRLPGYRACRACVERARRRTGSHPWRKGGRGRPPGG